ncbi:transmembrane protein 116 isoform X2 [Syngnathus acus]|uniref:transmembrane protein 116 isoform X2 n=1 Tax=Syngnathus acus TaxID=161584 RepID=UPI001885CD0D|nr:transmembrane protein 116 isoform X2 [Syngnathus acus]
MGLNGTLTAYQIDVLSTVYLVSLVPSVIGSCSVLVVSMVRWRHLKEQVHLLVQLSLADLAAALILMFTSAINKVGANNSVTICLYSLPLSLTFYLISFLLVAVYAWKSKNPIKGWRATATEDEGKQSGFRSRLLSLPVYMFVWLIPGAVYLAYVLTPFIRATPLIPDPRSTSIQDNAKYCTSCILFMHIWIDSCSDVEIIHDTFMRVFIFLVVIPVMLSCSVIYHKVGKWHEEHQQAALFPVEGDGLSGRRLKSSFTTARNMVMVILFCWAPALLVILLSTLVLWADVEQQSLFVAYTIQATSVSLQGFLNSLVYAWGRPNFTQAVIGESTPLVTYRHMAFFDESLSCDIRHDNKTFFR